MYTDQTIPIIVGVTGHRLIREQDRPVLSTAVKAQLGKLKELCPHSPLYMLNSLAEGADLLCADAAEALGIPLLAALPRERPDYEKDFSPAALARFAHHCERAERVFIAPATELPPEDGPSRNWEFRQAGIYVAAHCHVLLALWDGGPGKPSGCGTAEAVDFALRGSYTPSYGVSLRSSSNEAVIHILAPRSGQTSEAAGSVHMLGNREAVREVLRRTDDFNALCRALPPDSSSRLPADSGDDSAMTRLEAVSRAAGALSRKSAATYRRVLALLAVASALLTFAFLMYDEAQAIWMILVCGAMLLFAWGCQRWAVRSDCHRRYIEYRALAEGARVQTYLRYAGSRVRAARLLSWTQQEETAWVMDALCALNTGADPATRHDIRSCWVEAQRDYHHAAAARAGQKLQASERTVQTALRVSMGLYLAAVGFELLCGGLIFRPAAAVGDVEPWRTVLKIVLGSISAMTLFVANFYGRLSLPRTRSDHEKMERFYEKMSSQLTQRGQTEELLTVLAREELCENGNWCSYQRDNTPDISL